MGTESRTGPPIIVSPNPYLKCEANTLYECQSCESYFLNIRGQQVPASSWIHHNNLFPCSTCEWDGKNQRKIIKNIEKPCKDCTEKAVGKPDGKPRSVRKFVPKTAPSIAIPGNPLPVPDPCVKCVADPQSPGGDKWVDKCGEGYECNSKGKCIPDNCGTDCIKNCEECEWEDASHKRKICVSQCSAVTVCVIDLFYNNPDNPLEKSGSCECTFRNYGSEPPLFTPAGQTECPQDKPDVLNRVFNGLADCTCVCNLNEDKCKEQNEDSKFDADTCSCVYDANALSINLIP
jgi:hypothetical protein